MNRKALTYLLLVLIAWQSVTAVADVHPIEHSDEHSESAPFPSEFIGDSSAGLLGNPATTDPADQLPSFDELFHCHHHGCHCHVYLAGRPTASDFIHKHSLHNDYQALIPTAPSGSLYRPPKA